MSTNDPCRISDASSERLGGFGVPSTSSLAYSTPIPLPLRLVALWSLLQKKVDFFFVGPKWIRHGQVILAIQGNRIPIDDVREMLFLKPGDSFRSTFGSGRAWRLADRFFSTHTRIEFANCLCRFQSEEKSACRIYIVILKVQALEPRVLPTQAFFLHEHGQKPFLGDPIDTADQ